MPEWIRQKQKNWPTGSRSTYLKQLGVETAVQALERTIAKKKNNDFTEEFMNDLARAFAWRIIKSAKRKTDRKPDPGIPCMQEHLLI